MIYFSSDFDEQTADDWDVDMEIYTDPTGGDKDARDFMEMRQEQRRRKGIIDKELDPNHIGKFEKHTKVICTNCCDNKKFRLIVSIPINKSLYISNE